MTDSQKQQAKYDASCRAIERAIAELPEAARTFVSEWRADVERGGRVGADTVTRMGRFVEGVRGLVVVTEGVSADVVEREEKVAGNYEAGSGV